MKDFRFANRGRTFEEFIRFANGQYLKNGLAVVEKIPTEFLPIRDRSGRICSAKVEKKSTVDFIGRYMHHPIAFEAKNTQDVMRWDRVENHQASFLDVFSKCEGVITFVLVSFDLRQFYAVPWAFWSAAYKERVIKGNRTTPLQVDAHGIVWDIPKKFSFRAEEIPDVFEVPAHHTIYGLHYLINAEKYVVGGNQV